MKRVISGTIMLGLSFSLMLTGCSSNIYGLTNAEYRLVDEYFEADELVEDLLEFGYSDEDIEKELRAALAQVKYETGQ